MVIAALEVGIAFLRVRNWLRATFGDTKLFKNIDVMSLAVTAGKVAVYGLVGAVVLAGIVMANLAATVLLPFLAIGALAAGLYVGVKALGRLAVAAYDAGGNLIRGLVEGIKAGAKWVITAIENLASGAMKAFKSKLGIASPSRVALRAAIEVPRGVAVGINAGQPEVRRAVHGLTNLISLPTEQNRDPERTESSKPVVVSQGRQPAPARPQLPSVQIGELHVHSATDNPEAFGEAVKVAVFKLFAGSVTELGAALP
jgi:hypothetical protein